MRTSHFDHSEDEMNNDNDEPPEFVQIERCYLNFQTSYLLKQNEFGKLEKSES